MRIRCFSPGVMLGTWAIEWLLAVYTALRFRRSRLVLPAVATLFLLGTFQLAEYMICDRGGGEAWAKLGYVAITLLPPIGLLIADAAVRKRSRLTQLSLASAALLSVVVLLIPIVPICRGNYAIFMMNEQLGAFYGAWYLLVLGLTAWRLFSRRLTWLLIGYASFLVPAALVVVAAPQVYGGTPSIMCGFALIYAFILAFKVLPSSGGRRN